MWGDRVKGARPAGRRLVVYWCVVLVVGGVFGLRFLPEGPAAERLNTAAAVVAALFAVVAVVVAVPGALPAAERVSTPAQLDAAAQLLAREVLRQWREEVVSRGLSGGPPLMVRWSGTRLPVLDELRSVIAAVTGPAGGGQVVRLRLGGRIDGVAEEFGKLAVPRAVVLGVPGSGKTSLLALLTVGLLERASGPVPVLLALTSWDPAAEGLHAWIARRVAEDYVGLGNTRAYGVSAVSDLLADHRILPVLDGLDEMPASDRVRAIAAFNELPPAGPFVLSCRTEEYLEAVRAGGPLGAAPVVELEPVDVVAALDWIASTAPRAADVLRARVSLDGPGGPLSAALGTPLMAFLARATYLGNQRDPTELLDRSRFPDQASIELHLLEQYVPVVFAANLHQRRVARRPRGVPTSRRGRVPRQWRPARASAWLSFLADELTRQGSDDLSWWRLRRRSAVGRAAAACVVGLVAWVAFGLPAGLELGLGPGLRHGAPYAVLLAVLFGYRDMRAARYTERQLSRLSALADVVAGGLVAGVVAGVLAGVVSPVLGAAGGFAVLGLVLGLAGSTFTGQARRSDGRSPAALHGVIDGLVIWLLSWPAALLVLKFPQGSTWGLPDEAAASNRLEGAADELQAGLLYGSLPQLQACLLVGLAFALLYGTVRMLTEAAVQWARVTWLSVLVGASVGAGLGGLVLGPLGDPVGGVAAGLGVAAALTVQHAARGGSLGDRAERIWLNVATRAPGGILGGLAGGLGGVFVLSRADPAPSVAPAVAAGALYGGLMAGTGVGIGVGLLFGFAGVDPSRPARLSLRLRGRVRPLLLSLAGGLAAGAAATIVFTFAFGADYGTVRTVALGLFAGLAAGIGGWLFVPPPDGRAAGPATTLSSDRTAALAGGLLAGVAAGTETGLATDAVFGLMAALTTAVVVAWGMSWTGFSLTRAGFALRRRTPWRLMTFLEDARQLGVLRQVGPIYQFRHARLRAQLSHPGVVPEPSDTQPSTVQAHRRLGPARRTVTRIALLAAVLGAARLIGAALPHPGHPADQALRAAIAGAPTESYPLDRNDDGDTWEERNNADGTCEFSRAAYHVRTPTVDRRAFCWGPYLSSDPHPNPPARTAFQVQMSIRHGDVGGIDLFVQDQLECVFLVTRAGGYRVDAYTPTRQRSLIRSGFSPAMRTGVTQVNTLAIVIRADMIAFYVNDVLLVSTNRCGAHSDYLIYLLAGAVHTTADIRFTDARIWTG